MNQAKLQDERHYLLTYNRSQLTVKRIAIGVAFVVIVIFMLWDLQYLGWHHPSLPNILWVRAAICFPPLLWLYGCSYSSTMNRRLDRWILFAAFWIGFSILINIYQYSTIGYQLRVDGLLLFTFILYIVPGFYQTHKTFCGVVVALGYLALTLLLGWSTEKQVHGAVYLAIFNVAGSLHSWNYDRKTKSDFLNQLLLQRLAETDQLTGLYNRHGFDERLTELMQKAEADHGLLALVILDIDYFKHYNDSLGHLVGDRCLITVSNGLLNLRQSSDDLVVRFGGEEFLLVLFQSDGDEAHLLRRVENICPAIEQLAISHPSSAISDHITASAGASIYHPDSGVQRTELMQTADSALYRAKLSGRNQCIITGHAVEPQTSRADSTRYTGPFNKK